MLKIFISLIILALVIYVGLGLLLFLSQSSLLYYPDPTITATPGNIGLDFENVSFKTKDDVQLSGWYVPVENEKGTILFCHGNAGNISHRLDTIALFHRLGYGVFIFDYRGYGRSDGRPTEQGTYLDAEAAWNYLVRQKGIKPSRIVLFGRSLGGAVAVWLAAGRNPRGCILESTFSSVPDMAAALYPIFPARYICRFRYDSLSIINKISCPLYIIHSPDDEIIPYDHSRRLFTAAKTKKEFLQIRGNHNNGFILTGKKYVDGLQSFLAGLDGS